MSALQDSHQFLKVARLLPYLAAREAAASKVFREGANGRRLKGGLRRTTLFARDSVGCQRSQLRNGRVFLNEDYSHSRSTKCDVCDVRGTKRVKVALWADFASSQSIGGESLEAILGLGDAAGYVA